MEDLIFGLFFIALSIYIGQQIFVRVQEANEVNKRVLEILGLLDLYIIWKGTQRDEHAYARQIRQKIIDKWDILDELLVSQKRYPYAQKVRTNLRKLIYQKAGIATNTVSIE